MSGMRRVRHVLERCGLTFAVAIVAVSAMGAIGSASAADWSARAAYKRGHEHGYHAGYERGYDDAYKAALQEARALRQREERHNARPEDRSPMREQRYDPPPKNDGPTVQMPGPRYTRVAARIDSSVYAAAVEAGIPDEIVDELVRLFSYRVDFSRDIHPGDELDVVFEAPKAREGGANISSIIVAAMTLSGKTHTLYRFQSGGETEYFDANGRSTMGLLMRTPVNGSKISSRFGRRSNTVHEGIDFRVPRGTPVMAAGSGEVTFAGRSRGYGNLLVIVHGNGYSTAYAHLSRMAEGLRKGTVVRQGEVIAYSGATGNATGPHLHYEVRVNGRAVNPATVKEGFGRTLAGQEQARFIAERAWINQLVASLAVQKKLAQLH
jgi:murein DD-endopeptidase MepM/ murein hydrolase activator NlpD